MNIHGKERATDKAMLCAWTVRCQDKAIGARYIPATDKWFAICEYHNRWYCANTQPDQQGPLALLAEEEK